MNIFHDDAFLRALNEVSAKLFLESQTEEGVRKRIDRWDFKYAIKLMRTWFERRPEDVETLRRLKAYLIEKRAERRAIVAGYARTYRRNKKRAADDNRACAVCKASLAGKRAGALTCSTKCRVAFSRALRSPKPEETNFRVSEPADAGLA